MEEAILITYFNDFIFCPISIYYHRLYGKYDKKMYYSKSQFDGIAAHNTIDNKRYSSKKNILQGIDVYCSKYNLLGKIDLYDVESKVLIERKNKVNKIYDGYIFQVYAEYYAMVEMGFEIKKIKIYSFSDNKSYFVKLPNEDNEMREKFINLINNINDFDIETFKQTNCLKCKNCIYNTLCDRSIIC